MPGLRWQATRPGRRCRRDAGTRAGLLQGDPPCSSEDELRCLRPHRAGTGAITPHRSWPRRPWAAGACAGLEVCRSLPLYRQSEIYSREGVDLDRSTLAGWVGATSELLAPLVEAVRAHVMSASKLHADDTPVPVLAPATARPRPDGSGPMSGMTGPPAIRSLQPCGSPTRPIARERHPRQHLKHYKGALQADAYAGFQHLYEGGTIYEVACWAHARRKFHEIHIAHASPTTAEAIERIAALYAIEAEIRAARRRYEVGPSGTSKTTARQYAPSWLEDTLAKLSRKSDTAAAIRYALRAGRPSPAMSTTAISRSTTTPPNGRCASSRLDGRTSSSVVRTPVENAPPPSTRCSDRPSSTVSIQSSISSTCSNASPTTPSAGSTTCCLGTSPHFRTISPDLKCPHAETDGHLVSNRFTAQKQSLFTGKRHSVDEPAATTQNLSLYQAIEEFGRNLGAGIYAILVEVVVCGERKLSIGFDLRMNYSPIPTERDLGSYCSFNRIYRGRDNRNNNKIQSWLKRSSLKSSNLVLHYAIQLHDLSSAPDFPPGSS